MPEAVEVICTSRDIAQNAGEISIVYEFTIAVRVPQKDESSVGISGGSIRLYYNDVEAQNKFKLDMLYRFIIDERETF